MYIVNPDESADPGFALPVEAEAATKNFSGSPSLLSSMVKYGGIFHTNAGSSWDYVFVAFASELC
ncbi:MAG: hypothetical protein ACJ07L_14840 [Opitutales bacterium]